MLISNYYPTTRRDYLEFSCFEPTGLDLPSHYSTTLSRQSHRVIRLNRMLSSVTFITFLLVLLTGATAPPGHVYPKDAVLPDILPSVDKRDDYNETFDLGWQAQGLPLFSG